jgi:hypothetical protein
MLPRQGRSLQSWKTFLRNHAKDIASIDLFVVPTIAFRRMNSFATKEYAEMRHAPQSVSFYDVRVERD